MTFHFGVPSVTHCLLVEAGSELVLVDTGLGLLDYSKPSFKMRVFFSIDRVKRDPEESAIRQVVKLGYSPKDVRHIILTHLHLDHCGGLPDFPWAKVHVYAPEYRAAMKPKGFIDWFGYDQAHWEHNPQWVLHDIKGEKWFGLPGKPIADISSRCFVLVPLLGHSPGHCGVGVETESMWLLHCGDAYVREVQVDPDSHQSPFPTWASGFDRIMFPKHALELLRWLKRNYQAEVRTFSSHDHTSLAELRSTS
jgi:glyoxylase-like metal-dependent hydrolase (beta-lactamase superfamily II)